MFIAKELAESVTNDAHVCVLCVCYIVHVVCTLDYTYAYVLYILECMCVYLCQSTDKHTYIHPEKS